MVMITGSTATTSTPEEDDSVRNEAPLGKGPQKVIQILGSRRGTRQNLHALALVIEVVHPMADGKRLLLAFRFDKENGSLGHSG